LNVGAAAQAAGPEDILRIRALPLVIFVLLLAPAAWAQDAEPSAADYIATGQAYLRQDCQIAQFAFQAALRQEPDNQDAMLGKGEALVCQGQFELGIDEFRKVLQANPNSVRARIQLALAYNEQYQQDPARYAGRLTDALEILRIAAGLDRANPEVHNAKGIVLYQSGAYAEAQSAFEQAISLATQAGFANPALSTMNVNLGKSLRELGQLERARTAFRRAVMLNPADASAHNNLGQVLFTLGDCENAVYELAQAVSLNPASVDAAANLAISTFECGDVEGSIPLLKRAIDGGGGLLFPPLYTYLARAYLEQGRANEAVAEATKRALLPPATPEGFYWLGRAYEARAQANDREAAQRNYQRCLELDPNFSECRQALDALP
jgi:Flp pilus assembly protein TadD